MKAFVSYKWESESHNLWVEQLARDLRSRGIDALLDKWEVKLGSSFTDYMTHAISTADVVLFVVTPNSIKAVEASSPKGGAVKFEVQLATARKISGESFRFIAILKEGDRAPVHLKDCRYADFRKTEEYAEMMNLLVRDLFDISDKPPLGSFDHGPSFVECGQVGSELDSLRLNAEFVGIGKDLIVWEESLFGPTDPIISYKEASGDYRSEHLDCVSFATRVATTSRSDVLVIQEGQGVFVLCDNRILRRLPIARIGEPIIRSEAVHPTLPLIAVGTDYGKIVVWDFAHDKIVFERRYFPRENIVWISGLAFHEPAEQLFFCHANVLYRVRLSDGEIVSQHPLGAGEENEETGAIAINSRLGYVAIGTPINARVHDLDNDLALLYKVPIGNPWVEHLKFSANGALLGVVYGMGSGAGGVCVVDSKSGGVRGRFNDIFLAKSSGRLRNTRTESVSFSFDNSLLAIGEGGCIGLYRRQDSELPSETPRT